MIEKITTNKKYDPKLTLKDLNTILGPALTKEKYEDNHVAGVVTGLAWTSVGGVILFIEVSLSKGKGRLTLTGNLGDVMKESIQAARSYVRSRALAFGINPKIFEKYTNHWQHSAPYSAGITLDAMYGRQPVRRPRLVHPSPVKDSQHWSEGILLPTLSRPSSVA